jgi:phage terminase Nu1 subunit (DNA packaging protein)
MLTEVQVSKLFKVSIKTLQGWRASGIGPPFMKLGPGRQAAVRYERAVLVAYIANHRQSSKYDPAA